MNRDHMSPNNRCNENPWRRLPDQPLYVLPEDEEIVRRFNETAQENHQLRIDELLPEPFVGDPRAPVVLLSNNPGVGRGTPHRRDPLFMDRMRMNLLHE